MRTLYPFCCLLFLIPSSAGAGKWTAEGGAGQDRVDFGVSLVQDPEKKLLHELQTLKVRLYGTQIAMAHREARRGFFDDALEVLTSCDRELRNWEYDFLKRICKERAMPGKEFRQLRMEHGWANNIRFSPDGSSIVSCADSQWKGDKQFPSEVIVWDLASGRPTLTIRPELPTSIWAVEYTLDGSRILGGGWKGEVFAWDVQSGKVLFKSQLFATDMPGSPVVEIVKATHGRKVASVVTGGRVKLWDSDNGKELFDLGEQPNIESLAFTPNGGLLLSACGENGVKIWDTATGKKIELLKKRVDRFAAEPWLRCIDVSKDGTLIATGSGNRGSMGLSLFSNPVAPGPGLLHLWDAVTGENVLAIEAHESPVTSISFSPDGKRLASASDDGTIRLWDTHTGIEMFRLAATSKCVSFSPDGKRLACVEKGIVKIWSID